MAKQYDDDIVGWFTVKGKHIPIRKGQTKGDAIKSAFSKDGRVTIEFVNLKYGWFMEDYEVSNETHEKMEKLAAIEDIDAYVTEVSKQHVEHARVIDEDGSILIADKSSDRKDKVVFDWHETRYFSDATLIHNHPELTGRVSGFSSGDISTLTSTNLGEMWAVEKNKFDVVIYKLIKDKKKPPTLGQRSKFHVDYNNIRVKYRQDVLDEKFTILNNDYFLGIISYREFYEGVDKLSELESKALNKWLKENAGKYGYKFKKEVKHDIL